jgi:hypothetical protein
MQTWRILVSMISTTLHTTLVSNTRWNFDHNNLNSFIKKTSRRCSFKHYMMRSFLDHLAHYLQTT